MKRKPYTLEYDRTVMRRFSPNTGTELTPFIEVGFMQDRVKIRPGDLVRVTVTLLYDHKRKKWSKP